MALVAKTKGKVGYRDDTGTVFFTFQDTGITSQAKLGEVTLTGSETQLPKAIKARFTTVRNAANKLSRKVRVFSASAPILTTGATINLNATVSGVFDGISFVSEGHLASEERPRGNAGP